MRLSDKVMAVVLAAAVSVSVFTACSGGGGGGSNGAGGSTSNSNSSASSDSGSCSSSSSSNAPSDSGSSSSSSSSSSSGSEETGVNEFGMLHATPIKNPVNSRRANYEKLMTQTYTRVYTIESKDEYGNVKRRNYTDSTNGVRTYQEDDYSFVLSDAEQGKVWFIWKDNLLPTTVQPYKPSEKLDTDLFWRQAEMVEGKYKFGSIEYDAEALIEGRLDEPTNTFHKDIQIACFSKGKKYPDYILYVDEVLGDDEPVVTLQMVEQNKEFYTEAVAKYMDFEQILSDYT